MILIPPPKSIQISSEKFKGDADKIVKKHDKSLPPQHYQLAITPTEIISTSNSDVGFFYATETLKQILQQSASDIPCLTITDSPDFEKRGFMLDISRCQVPTLKSLFELIDTLATLKINQLQLYIEHTFAYPGHQLVWGDASPLTPRDIQVIDNYCKKHFIDLVANQNSLGHMERWLQYPEYCFLAECPQGFIHPISKEHCSPSTLKPNGESLAFLNKLYASLLPNFTTDIVHVGMDEPWELGQGWSKSMVAAEGKHEVFMRFLTDVHNLVQDYAKHMLFWADMVIEKPELANKIPPGSIPVIWGYEEDTPFEEQCAAIAPHAETFYVAAGTSTWNSFSGRLDNALNNLKNAAKAGLKHKAQGYLINQWGDQGNHQPWSIVYPPLVQGAASAWNVAQSENLGVEEALNEIIFHDTSQCIGTVLCKLGRIENDFNSKLRNKSFNHCFFFGSDKIVENTLQLIGPLEMGAQSSQLDEIDHLANSSQLHSPHIDIAKEDIHLATDMIRWANRRALSTLPSCESPYLRSALQHLIGRYKERWLQRNRPGGLHESTNYLRKML